MSNVRHQLAASVRFRERSSTLVRQLSALFQLSREMSLLPRACLVAAFVSMLIYALTFVPSLRESLRSLIFFQFAVMALLLCTLIVLGRHHAVAWKYKRAQLPPMRFPSSYWLLLAVALAFSGVNFFLPMNEYPERSPIPDRVLLRVFSSAWLLLLLVAAAFSHWSSSRLRAFHSLPKGADA